MEKKLKLSYLILGIGIGIICTSALYSFFPKTKYIELSNDIIIEKARELGMVLLKESIQEEPKEEEVEKIEVIEEVTEENVEEPVDIELEKIEIIVEGGSTLTEVATQLHNKGLIEDMNKFILYVRGKKLDKSIRTGKHEIEVNSSFDEIVEALTRRPD